jgi:hypothetical protein
MPELADEWTHKCLIFSVDNYDIPNVKDYPKKILCFEKPIDVALMKSGIEQELRTDNRKRYTKSYMMDGSQ